MTRRDAKRLRALRDRAQAEADARLAEVDAAMVARRHEDIRAMQARAYSGPLYEAACDYAWELLPELHRPASRATFLDVVTGCNAAEVRDRADQVRAAFDNVQDAAEKAEAEAQRRPVAERPRPVEAAPRPAQGGE